MCWLCQISTGKAKSNYRPHIEYKYINDQLTINSTLQHFVWGVTNKVLLLTAVTCGLWNQLWHKNLSYSLDSGTLIYWPLYEWTDLEPSGQVIGLPNPMGEAFTTTDQDGRGWWNGISSQTLWGSHPHCRKKITSLRTIISTLKRLHSREWLKCIQIWHIWRENLEWGIVQVLPAPSSRLATHKLTRALGISPVKWCYK